MLPMPRLLPSWLDLAQCAGDSDRYLPAWLLQQQLLHPRRPLALQQPPGKLLGGLQQPPPFLPSPTSKLNFLPRAHCHGVRVYFPSQELMWF
jgi:hypothetical protein